MVELHDEGALDLGHNLELPILVLLVLEHMLEGEESPSFLLLDLRGGTATRYTLPKVPVPIRSTAS